MTQEKERPAGSQSLFRGLMLIEILSDSANGCPLVCICRSWLIWTKVISWLLQGLQSCGYDAPRPPQGVNRYRTCLPRCQGRALLRWIWLGLRRSALLEALNIATGETINFSSREDDHAILIYKLEPTTGMLNPCLYWPAYAALLFRNRRDCASSRHTDYVKSYWENHQHEIQPLTRNTITELPAMFDELAHIRESGAAIDREENELASPVLLFRCLIFMGGCRTPC